MNRSSVSTLEDEVSYLELFSVFDNAQQYFTDPQDGAFDDLLSTASQLSTGIGKECTRNVQLRRKYVAKLRSVEDRLKSISATNESRKAQCQDQEQVLVDLVSRITSYRAAYKDLNKQFMDIAKENVMLSLDRSQAIPFLAERSLNRLRAKLKSDDDIPSTISTAQDTTGLDDDLME